MEANRGSRRLVATLFIVAFDSETEALGLTGGFGERNLPITRAQPDARGRATGGTSALSTEVDERRARRQRGTVDASGRAVALAVETVITGLQASPGEHCAFQSDLLTERVGSKF